MGSTNTSVSVGSVVDFVHYEASLADAHRLQDWLALWNPERAAYLVPYPNEEAGKLRVAIIRDDFEKLCERIERLSGGAAHAQNPPSRLVRVIGRVITREGEDRSIVASSNFMCFESRPDREMLWAGTTVHTIARRSDGEGLELWSKEVRLVNAQSEIPALAFLI